MFKPSNRKRMPIGKLHPRGVFLKPRRVIWIREMFPDFPDTVVSPLGLLPGESPEEAIQALVLGPVEIVSKIHFRGETFPRWKYA